jgi:hypothetical protein
VRVPGLVLAGFLLAVSAALAEDPKAKLRAELKDGDLSGDWIYDDLDAGFARAVKEGKPLLAVFRCVP